MLVQKFHSLLERTQKCIGNINIFSQKITIKKNQKQKSIIQPVKIWAKLVKLQKNEREKHPCCITLCVFRGKINGLS